MMGLAVARTPWLFERFDSMLTKGAPTLPGLLVEQQCDAVKTDGHVAIMTQISFMVMAAVSACDASSSSTAGSEAAARREYCHGMTKYGQRSDASRDRPERKLESVMTLKRLMAELAQLTGQYARVAEHAQRCLTWLQRLEAAGEQIHDMADAINSAIHKCGTLHGEANRQQIAELRAQIKKIPQAAMRPSAKEKKPRKVAAKAASPRKKRTKSAEDRAIDAALKDRSYPILIDVTELDDEGRRRRPRSVSRCQERRRRRRRRRGRKKKKKKTL